MELFGDKQIKGIVQENTVAVYLFLQNENYFLLWSNLGVYGYFHNSTLRVFSLTAIMCVLTLVTAGIFALLNSIDSLKMIL